MTRNDPSNDAGDGYARRTVLKAVGASGAGLSAFDVATGRAAAAEGDVLGEVTLTDTGDGVGITFTGDYLLVPDGHGTNRVDVHELPSDGDGASTRVASKTLPNPVDVVEWDPNREKIWATDTGDPVWLFDVGDLTETETIGEEAVTRQFSVPTDDRENIVDGLAYDGQEDALWYSWDGSSDVLQFGADGTLKRRITPELTPDGDEFDHISGVAVAANKGGRQTLYLGNNPEQANGDIVRVYADDGGHLLRFATDTGFRVEDLVCDPVTYDSEAVLIRDARNDRYQAREVPAGTCPLPGEKSGGGGLSIPGWVTCSLPGGVLGALLGGGAVWFMGPDEVEETPAAAPGQHAGAARRSGAAGPDQSGQPGQRQAPPPGEREAPPPDELRDTRDRNGPGNG